VYARAGSSWSSTETLAARPLRYRQRTQFPPKGSGPIRVGVRCRRSAAFHYLLREGAHAVLVTRHDSGVAIEIKGVHPALADARE
jgi:hypothetical protein